MSKYTPGPWLWGAIKGHDGALHKLQIGPAVGPGPICVLDIARGEGDAGRVLVSIHEEEAKADARLIAAAPKLLEAARKLSKAVEDGGFLGSIISEAQAEMDAAIAEAEGSDR